jgi:hypothetical protein
MLSLPCKEGRKLGVVVFKNLTGAMTNKINSGKRQFTQRADVCRRCPFVESEVNFFESLEMVRVGSLVYYVSFKNPRNRPTLALEQSKKGVVSLSHFTISPDTRPAYESQRRKQYVDS